MNRLALVFDILDAEVEALARAASIAGEVVLVSDVRSPRVEALQSDIGADLQLATHRMVDAGHGLRHSDFELAFRVARLHFEDPFTAIVYSGGSVCDLSWYEPSLRDVPRGRMLTGLLADWGRIIEDKIEFAVNGPTVMALSGDAATSDFVLGPRLVSLLPEWIDVTQMRTQRVVPEADAVVDVRGLGVGETLMRVRRAAERCPDLILVVGSNRIQGQELQLRMDRESAGRVVFGLRDDPWMIELLPGTEDTPARGDGGFDWETIPAVRSVPNVRVSSGGDVAAIGSLLGDLIAAGSDDVVIAVWDDPRVADAFAGSRALLADIGFASTPQTPMGDLDPVRLRDDVVMVGARARRAAMETLSAAPDFETFVRMLTEPGLLASAVVGLVPAERGSDVLALRTIRKPTDLCTRVTPPFLPVPNMRAEEHPPPGPFDAKRWIGGLTWSTRWRLALPWRWHLLPRAMKDRW